MMAMMVSMKVVALVTTVVMPTTMIATADNLAINKMFNTAPQRR
jgi:hypothetical protein